VPYTNSGTDSISISKPLVSTLELGEHNILVYTSTGIYKLTVTVVTKILTTASAFQSDIEADYGGYYILGDDLDFTDLSIGTIGTVFNYNDTDKEKNFHGTLDGRGHALTNIIIDTEGQTHKTMQGSLFGVLHQGGVIKNIYVELTPGYLYNSGMSRPNGVSLVGATMANTLIQNVYLKINYTWDGTSSGSCFASGICNLPFGTGTKISNCIVDIVTTIENPTGTTWLIGYDYSYVAVPEYCYGITNGKDIPLKLEGSDRVIDTCESFDTSSAFLASVTSLPANKGWAKYWTLQDGILKFGDKVIYTAD